MTAPDSMNYNGKHYHLIDCTDMRETTGEKLIRYRYGAFVVEGETVRAETMVVDMPIEEVEKKRRRVYVPEMRYEEFIKWLEESEEE